MSTVKQLEKQIQQLTEEELAAFRRWFTEFDAEVWDRRLEADVLAGKLDSLAEQALRDHESGRSTKF